MSQPQLVRAEQIYLKSGETFASLRRLASYWTSIADGYRSQHRFLDAEAAAQHAKHYAQLADLHAPHDPEPPPFGRRAA